MRAELGLDATGMEAKIKPGWHNPYSTPAMLKKLFMAEWQHAIQPLRKNRPSRFPTLLGCMTFGEPDRGNHAWTLPERAAVPSLNVRWKAA